MNFSSSLIEQAVLAFSRLPGIGKKTAIRLVLHLLKQEPGMVQQFTSAIHNMRENIRFCQQCHNVADDTLCRICANPGRKNNQICVVESIRDVMALESTQQYNGVYHVLGGLISPLDGVSPDQLHIQTLVDRVRESEIEEVIMAVSATLEGDTTAYYVSRKLDGLPVRITTLSRGVAFGGELEYADELTLARSLQGRMPIEQVVNGQSN